MLLYLDKKKERKWGKCWGLKRKLKQHKVCGRFFGKGLNYCPRYPKSDLPLVIFCACEKEKEEKKHADFGMWRVKHNKTQAPPEEPRGFWLKRWHSQMPQSGPEILNKYFSRCSTLTEQYFLAYRPETLSSCTKTGMINFIWKIMEQGAHCCTCGPVDRRRDSWNMSRQDS